MITPVYSKIRETEGIVALMRLLGQVEPTVEEGEIIVFGPGIPMKMVMVGLDVVDRDGGFKVVHEWMQALAADLRAAIQPVMEARLASLEARLRDTLFDAVLDDGGEGGDHAA
jgi:hypothetical protein